MQPSLLSIQVGLPRDYGSPAAADPHDRPWTTGFFKQPVTGPVQVARTQLAGDGQADLSVHGGVDKAVLAYSADHYTQWRLELGLPDLPHGAFGENLTITGLDESTVCIGDVWQFGPVRLEVSQPRQPCWKLARRWRLTDLPRRVVDTGRTGWYFRVLTEGAVIAGLTPELVERPHGEWTIARANDVHYHGRADRASTAALAACAALSESWRMHLLGRLANTVAD